jgi:hypothetical protein
VPEGAALCGGSNARCRICGNTSRHTGLGGHSEDSSYIMLLCNSFCVMPGTGLLSLSADSVAHDHRVDAGRVGNATTVSQRRSVHHLAARVDVRTDFVDMCSFCEPFSGLYVFGVSCDLSGPGVEASAALNRPPIDDAMLISHTVPTWHSPCAYGKPCSGNSGNFRCGGVSVGGSGAAQDGAHG